MSSDAMTEDIASRCRRAKQAGHQLARASAQTRSELLRTVAAALADSEHRRTLAIANADDRARAKQAVGRGELTAAAAARIALDDAKLDALVDGLRQLAATGDTIGRIEIERELDDGLVLQRVTCPLGVLAAVFEARPDAVPQIAGLAIRTGNAIVLKGGREADLTIAELVRILQRAVVRAGFTTDLICRLEDRSEVNALLTLQRSIDLVVARGGAAFVAHVRRTSTIPVLAHADGICHVFLHRAADPAMAARIVVDAKCSYPAACNAVETILWDAPAQVAIRETLTALLERRVEVRGCPTTRRIDPRVQRASRADWDTEHGNLTIGIRQVPDLEAAIEHIETHGSKHTDAIVTADADAASEFLGRVDSANVFHNASTRFADGYRYGLGAEVGISTQKLHARGPVGPEGLVTYRWLLRGHGHVATDYGPTQRKFKHQTS